MALFHHAKAFGNQVYAKGKEFAFVLGIQEREKFVVFPHVESLCAIPNASSQSVPTATSLFNL